MQKFKGIFLLAGLSLAAFPACGKKEEKGGDKPTTSAAGDSKGDKPAAGGLKVTQVAAGASASCALMDNGTVRCWGRNDGGEMGTEKSETDQATPVEVPGVKGATKLWFGGDSGSSGDMVCAQVADGAITCWGGPRNKPLKADGKWATTPEDIPGLKGVKDIALGGGTFYALKADGSVVGWGNQVFNNLGNGETSNKELGYTPINGIAGATAVAAGQNHGCVVLADSTVSCWGYSRHKQNATPVADVTDVVSITAGSGGSDTCAIKKDKSVVCWGDAQKPRPLEGLANVKQLDARNHFCALDEAGDVYCWGSNWGGQLGNGEKGGSSSKPEKVAGISKATSVAAGQNTSCAATADGAMCWGYNQRGQLGDGTLVDRFAPTAVVGLTDAKLGPAKDGTDEVQESDVAMDWEGLPEGCTKPEKLEASSTNLKGDFNVVAAYATSKMDGKTIGVDIANYKLDPAASGAKPRGKQFKLNLRFGKVNVDTKETFPVDLGDYIFGLKEERKVASSVSYNSGGFTLATLSLEGASPGTVSIKHLDENWVCGDMDLKTKTSSFKGPWAARIVK